jgi:HD-GYP domain-containing protein (c-di-GMP phosphodiesterase class II)
MSQLNQSVILICEDNKAVLNFLSFNLACEYNFKIADVDTLSRTLKLILDPHQLRQVISNSEVPKNNLTEVSALSGIILGHTFCDLSSRQEIFKALKQANLSIPVICLVAEETTTVFDINYPKLRSIQYLESQFIEKFTEIVKDFFVKIETTEKFVAVPIATLIYFAGTAEDLFIKLVTGRLLKMFSKGDHVADEDIDRLSKKGVRELFVKKEAAMWVLKILKENLASVFKGDLTALNFKNFLEEKEGSEEETEIAEIVEKKVQAKNAEAEMPLEKNTGEVEAETFKETENILARAPFEQEQKLISEVHQKKKELINRLKKVKGLGGFLKNAKIDREAKAYFQMRSELVTFIACGLAKELDWASEAAVEKLIYVAHLHDVALVNYPHLTKIQSKAELLTMDHLSKKELDLIQEHPLVAVNLVKMDPSMPLESDTIIAQHHERPNGAGFPKSLATVRILPFAALIGISINFAQYIIETPNWKFEEYKKVSKLQFTGGVFTKIYMALEKIMAKK